MRRHCGWTRYWRLQVTSVRISATRIFERRHWGWTWRSQLQATVVRMSTTNFLRMCSKLLANLQKVHCVVACFVNKTCWLYLKSCGMHVHKNRVACMFTRVPQMSRSTFPSMYSSSSIPTLNCVIQLQHNLQTPWNMYNTLFSWHWICTQHCPILYKTCITYRPPWTYIRRGTWKCMRAWKNCLQTCACAFVFPKLACPMAFRTRVPTQ